MKLDSLPTDFVSLFGKSRTGLSLRDFWNIARAT